MSRVIVTGQGTGVGKTVAAGVLMALLMADYWKPIEAGTQEESDSATIQKWFQDSMQTIFVPAYRLHAPLSPHHAARLQNIAIQTETIVPPATEKPLVIETVGGILVPLNSSQLSLDLYLSWKAHWIVVSQHYLGSINHTLMTIQCLQTRKASIIGVVFNGLPHPDSEKAILRHSQLPLLGRILPEKKVTTQTLHHYAEQWKHHFPSLSEVRRLSGTPLLK